MAKNNFGLILIGILIVFAIFYFKADLFTILGLGANSYGQTFVATGNQISSIGVVLGGGQGIDQATGGYVDINLKLYDSPSKTNLINSSSRHLFIKGTYADGGTGKNYYFYDFPLNAIVTSGQEYYFQVDTTSDALVLLNDPTIPDPYNSILIINGVSTDINSAFNYPNGIAYSLAGTYPQPNRDLLFRINSQNVCIPTDCLQLNKQCGSWSDGCGGTLLCGTDSVGYPIISCPSGYQCTSEGHCTILSCTPNWQCTSWSTCTNSIQTRTCTDSNNCGTTTGKPAESKSCSVNGGYCGDGTCGLGEDSTSCSEDCSDNESSLNYLYIILAVGGGILLLLLLSKKRR